MISEILKILAGGVNNIGMGLKFKALAEALQAEHRQLEPSEMEGAVVELVRRMQELGAIVIEGKAAPVLFGGRQLFLVGVLTNLEPLLDGTESPQLALQSRSVDQTDRTLVPEVLSQNSAG